MNILITGGAGFIGSHLAKQLVKKTHSVIILDNLDTGKIKNIETIKNKITFVKGTILDYNLVDSLVSQVTIVYHLAAKVAVQGSNKKEYEQTNVLGTKNLLEASLNHSIQKFIFVSSAAVYGNTKKLPICEDTITKPISDLGRTKLQGEILCMKYHSKGLTTTILRLFNVYGPFQNNTYSSLIPTMSTNFLKKRKSKIYGNGDHTRDFIHVDDIISSFLSVLNYRYANNYLFNIGTGKEYSILDIYKLLSKITRLNIDPDYFPKRDFEIEKSYACICKARKFLHFQPKIKLYTGLKKLLAHEAQI